MTTTSQARDKAHTGSRCRRWTTAPLAALVAMASLVGVLAGPLALPAAAAGAPAVTGVSPLAGPVVGGTKVTITGSGFTGASAVAFGSTPASAFTVNSDTRITATAPAGASTTVQVKVTTAGGVSATSPAAYYSYGTRAVAWGDDQLGQSTVPAGLGDVIAVAAGVCHSLALKADGTVVAWG